MSKSDARKAFRIEVRIPVRVQLESRKLDGEILNLSEGGAYVQCAADWRVGQTVTLEIQFSGKVVLAGKATSWEELRGKAIHSDTPRKQVSGIPDLPLNVGAQTVVRWTVTVDKPGADNESKGFGVEFTQLASTDREALRKVIRYYDAIRKAGVQFD